jgi:hypothetical protein
MAGIRFRLWRHKDDALHRCIYPHVDVVFNGLFADGAMAILNVKSAPEDAFVALASQPGYFLHPLEIFIMVVLFKDLN